MKKLRILKQSNKALLRHEARQHTDHVQMDSRITGWADTGRLCRATRCSRPVNLYFKKKSRVSEPLIVYMGPCTTASGPPTFFLISLTCSLLQVYLCMRIRSTEIASLACPHWIL